MTGLFEVLFEASVRSVALAAVVYLLLWALRVREAAWRHAAWTAVLAAMLFMPLLPGLFPPVPVALPAPVEPLALFVEPVRVIAAPPVDAPVAAPAVFDWTGVWMPVYAGGAFVMLFRLFLGWISARRLWEGSQFVSSLRAYESPRIAAPMTIGDPGATR